MNCRMFQDLLQKCLGLCANPAYHKFCKQGLFARHEASMNMIIELNVISKDVIYSFKEELDYRANRTSASGPENDPHTVTGSSVRHCEGGKLYTRGPIPQELSRMLRKLLSYAAVNFLQSCFS